ncbi:MAG: hypothetical protein ACI9R3_001697 [Verrucomicrobiales bacterium]|jgi:hypothetical protein
MANARKSEYLPCFHDLIIIRGKMHLEEPPLRGMGDYDVFSAITC